MFTKDYERKYPVSRGGYDIAIVCAWNSSLIYLLSPLLLLLTKVTTVKVTKPSRAKDAIPHVDVCLTVNFQKGGGIDLKFNNKEDRDVWKDVLDELVKEAKDGADDDK